MGRILSIDSVNIHMNNINKDRMQYQSDADAHRELERMSLWSIPFALVWIIGAVVHWYI
jgi:hypothetical protein